MTFLMTLLAAAAVAAGTQATVPAGPAPAGLHMAQAATPLQIPAAPASGAAAGTTPAPASGATTTAPAPAAPSADSQPDDQPQVDPNAPQGEGGDTPNQQLSLGEIPVIETMELTPDIARRAIDSYLVAKEKYADAGLDQYENLQDFVDQTPEGKKFEVDVKAAGFANVTDWNLAVTTLGVIHGSVVDDQTPDLLQQISEVESDTELAQDIKDRMIKALKAMIPSPNNKKILQDLMADPVYGPKLKQLDTEQE